eukprot:Nitzschia sp. Nitz4//scaffold295_size27985//23263//23550//NITZ4_008164-RA/size27985-processed-gene-0.61-mRNA-1//-1//CDS//3329546254//4731//frame0
MQEYCLSLFSSHKVGDTAFGMSLADGKSGVKENGSISKGTEVVSAVSPNGENPTTGDEVIEIDYGMIDSAKAKRVMTFHLDERFLKTEITGKRTL